MIKEAEISKEFETELKYQDEYYNEVLDFDLDKPMVGDREKIENALSSKATFI